MREHTSKPRQFTNLTAVSEPIRSADGMPAIPRPTEQPLAAEVIPEIELAEDLQLAPAVELVVDDTPELPAELEEEDDEAGLAEPSQQFTLRDMMLLTLIAAVGFGVLRLFPPALFAGAMGGIAILGLAVLTIAKPERVIFHLIWWTILGIYIISSVFAVIKK
jgi:hypothetical protein